MLPMFYFAIQSNSRRDCVKSFMIGLPSDEHPKYANSIFRCSV